MSCCLTTPFTTILKFGKENATREEVIAAAKLAQCDEFIDRLPMGYDTIIGENGKTPIRR